MLLWNVEEGSEREKPHIDIDSNSLGLNSLGFPICNSFEENEPRIGDYKLLTRIGHVTTSEFQCRRNNELGWKCSDAHMRRRTSLPMKRWCDFRN